MGVIKKQGTANTAVVFGGTIIGAFSLLLVQPHFLTKEELGLTRLILAFATVLASVLSFGISSVTVRYLPRLFDRTRGHRGFFGFLLIYLSISVTLGLALLFLLREPLNRAYGGDAGLFTENFRFVILLSVSYSFVLGFNAYCMALLRSVFPTFLNDIVVRILFIAAILFHFAGWLDLDGFLLVFCLIYSAQAMALFAYTYLVDRPSLRPDLVHIRREIGIRSIVRYGAVITFTAINSVSLKYLDSIFVGRISVDHVAIYSVAAFIGLIIELPLNALERIANPAIAHALAAKDMEQVRTIYHRSARGLLVLGGWMFILVTTNVRDVLELLPPGFDAGADVAMVIAFGALINMATGINNPILVNSDRYIHGSVFLMVLLGITLLGNWLLIPRLGMLGAAVTTCFANVIYNGLKFGFIRRNFGMQPFDRNTLWITVSIAVMAVGGSLFDTSLHPIANVLLRVTVLSVSFVVLIVRGHFADEILAYAPTWLRRRSGSVIR